MNIILKQASLASEESVDCMVYQALRAYQDHQVSEAVILPVHRHNIVFSSSLVSEIFVRQLFLTVSSKALECASLLWALANNSYTMCNSIGGSEHNFKS